MKHAKPLKFALIVLAFIVVGLAVTATQSRISDTGVFSDSEINATAIYVGSEKLTKAFTITVCDTNICDYVTDGIDDNVQIQAAHDYVEGLTGGGTVKLMAQAYNCSKQLNWTQGIGEARVNLIGEGPQNTKIYFNQSGGLFINTSLTNDGYQTFFRDFEVYGVDIGSGISIKDSGRVQLSNLRVTHFALGMNVTDELWGVYSDMFVRTNTAGWYALSTTSNKQFIGERVSIFDGAYFQGYNEWDCTSCDIETGILELKSIGHGTMIGGWGEGSTTLLINSTQDFTIIPGYFAGNITLDNTARITIVGSENNWDKINILSDANNTMIITANPDESDIVDAGFQTQIITPNFDYKINSVISKGLLLYMPFEENSTTVMDWSEKSKDGLVGNAKFNTTGVIGNSYYFDGTTDGITVAEATDQDFNITNSPITISVWVRPTGAAGSQMIFDTTNNFGAGLELYLRSGAGSQDVAFIVNNGTTKQYLQAGNIGWTSLEWKHIVARYNGTTMTVCVDLSCTTNMLTSAQAKGTYLGGRIGLQADGAGYGFIGQIDEMKIYNRAISDAEIKELYYLSETLHQKSEGAWLSKENGGTVYGTLNINNTLTVDGVAGYTGACADGTALTVVEGLITGCS